MLAEPERQAEEVALSAYQRQVLSVPLEHDLALFGGQGGGKSTALAFLALRHAEQAGADAAMLYVRRSYPAGRDFEHVTRTLFSQVYGGAASFNASEHVWRLPGGATLELGQLDGEADLLKFQGRSFSLVMVDEAGQYADPYLIDQLRGTLRRGMNPRMVLAGNPGGAGHWWIAQRYIAAEAWQPFTDSASGRTFVLCPSTVEDNPFVTTAYRDQLAAAYAGDPQLARARIKGDWAAIVGSFFGGCLSDRSRFVWADPEGLQRLSRALPGVEQAMSWWEHRSRHWERFLAYDHGSASPAVAYLCALSPGDRGPDGRWYARGSVLLVDEVSTADPRNPARGSGATVPEIGALIRGMCRRWWTSADGVADPSIHSRTGTATIADAFEAEGVTFREADNDRKAGWSAMRTLMAQAGQPDLPGLYVSRRCAYFWQTVPSLPRSQRDPEDVDTRAVDHAADAARYGVMEAVGNPQPESVRWYPI